MNEKINGIDPMSREIFGSTIKFRRHDKPGVSTPHQGLVIARCDAAPERLIVETTSIANAPNFKSELIIVSVESITDITPRCYAAWGLDHRNKIIVGDTKNNEPYAMNSFRKHMGIEPIGIITTARS